MARGGPRRVLPARALGRSSGAGAVVRRACRMRLVGVGVGPGDPELITVKAVRELREAAVVFVPVTDTGEVGRAEATVLAYVSPDRVRRLRFAIHDDDARNAAWDAAGAAVVEA